jgi:hypothetical protein
MSADDDLPPARSALKAAQSGLAEGLLRLRMASSARGIGAPSGEGEFLGGGGASSGSSGGPSLVFAGGVRGRGVGCFEGGRRRRGQLGGTHYPGFGRGVLPSHTRSRKPRRDAPLRVRTLWAREGGRRRGVGGGFQHPQGIRGGRRLLLQGRRRPLREQDYGHRRRRGRRVGGQQERWEPPSHHKPVRSRPLRPPRAGDGDMWGDRRSRGAGPVPRSFLPVADLRPIPPRVTFRS